MSRHAVARRARRTSPPAHASAAQLVARHRSITASPNDAASQINAATHNDPASANDAATPNGVELAASANQAESRTNRPSRHTPSRHHQSRHRPSPGSAAAPRRPRPALPAFARPVSIKIIARPALVAAAVIATVAGADAAQVAAPNASADQPTKGSSASATASGEGTSAPAAGSYSAAGATAQPAGTPSTTLAPESTTHRVSRAKRADTAPKVLGKPGQTVAGVWVKPNPGPMTSCFCLRWGAMHWGIDLAGPLGSPILAVGDGVVLKAGADAGFGNWVVIQHANGDVSIYGHMRYYFVQPGQKVKAGEKIALVGSEGQSTGPHLHFEIHKGGLEGPRLDPVPWLKARGISVGPYLPNA